MPVDRLDLAALACAAAQIRQMIDDAEAQAFHESRLAMLKESINCPSILRLLPTDVLVDMRRRHLQQSVDRLESLRYRLSLELGVQPEPPLVSPVAASICLDRTPQPKRRRTRRKA